MENIKFYYTNDGSIGLFDECVDDIYHATSGAFSEAIDKFIIPSGVIELAGTRDKIKVLDICYGIGYNTKAFLSKVYNCRIEIDAIEYNENLFILSAFLKDKHVPSNVQKKLVDIIFDIYKSNQDKVENLLKDISISLFISRNKLEYWHFLTRTHRYLPSACPKGSFLHNIYYHYASFRYFLTLRSPSGQCASITPHLIDARQALKLIQGTYDVVFLDAFTPAKQPTLWTFDFFELLKSLMGEDSILITYSNSAAVRAALVANGFYLGKTLDKNGKRIGTVAALSADKIKLPLTEFEIGLLNTTAGIFYEDTSLINSEKIIKLNRELKVSTSTRQSSSAYIKKYRKLNAI